MTTSAPSDSSSAVRSPHNGILLLLPPSVRHRIYLYVNVVLRKWDNSLLWIHLNDPRLTNDKYDDDPISSRSLLWGRKSDFFTPCHGLLLSCRAIYAEVSSLLYSTNMFSIRYSDNLSLAPLRNLLPSSLSNLAHLRIILSAASCYDTKPSISAYKVRDDPDDPDRCCNGWINVDGSSEGCRNKHDPPLHGDHPQTQQVLAEWSSTVDYLASHISPGILNLAVVCDLSRDDTDTAMQVLQPLHRLPLLKNCHIRLCEYPSATLMRLARDTALQLRGAKAAQLLLQEQRVSESSATPQLSKEHAGSRLLALPQELRLRILEYTDLVLPWKEVMWSRGQRGFQLLTISCLYLDETGPCDPEVHHGCQFVNCWADVPGTPIGCFCGIRHAAFSSSCRCWRPPQALFLVCRTLCEDARIIFYTKNRFVVADHSILRKPSAIHRESPYPHSRLAASIFLTDVVPEGVLREIRSLELMFPPYHPGTWPQTGHEALLDWENVLRWASERLNLSALTIRVTTVFDEIFFLYERLNMTAEQARSIFEGYYSIIVPLAPLAPAGLAMFYATLQWPEILGLTYPAPGIQDDEQPVLLRNERQLQQWAEWLVLGDRYVVREHDGRGTEEAWNGAWRCSHHFERQY